MDNPANIIIGDIWNYFFVLSDDQRRKQKHQNSHIQFNAERLSECGDVSFPSCLPITWRNYVLAAGGSVREARFLRDTGNDEQTLRAAEHALLGDAQHWRFPVERVIFSLERCQLFFRRQIVMTQILRLVLSSSIGGDGSSCYGHLQKDTGKRIYLRPTYGAEQTKLSEHRAKLLEETLLRILAYSAWQLQTAEPNAAAGAGGGNTVQLLQVISVASKEFQSKKKAEPSKYVLIKCGLVRDPCTGKLCTMPVAEYLSQRTNDMRLLAMHKYGLREKSENRFLDNLSTRLGAATVIIDMLSVKHSSPVQIVRDGAGSSRGASFIMYNSARLESLLRHFNERVDAATYAQLPALDDMDFSLLNVEEEWHLVFGYIFTFPNLIERALEQLERGLVATHLIVRYISEFMSAFSVYYKHVRILTQSNQEHIPLMYARIYLVMAVRNILNKALALLNIEPITIM